MVELKVNINEVSLKADGSRSTLCAEATLGIATLVNTIAEALECPFDEAMMHAASIIKRRRGLHKDD